MFVDLGLLGIALGRALEWEAPLVLAAPCCHHDIAAQLRTTDVPEPYAMITRHGILRERFADVLTDALRAAVLRLVGYRVDVVEFVDSAHTPRNALLRAVRTGAAPTAGQVAEYRELTAAWGCARRWRSASRRSWRRCWPGRDRRGTPVTAPRRAPWGPWS